MNKLKKIAATIAFAMFSFFAQAQTASNDSILKTNGKIYVVMIVVIVIVAGLFLYLLNLDRKINKLEKKN